MNVSGAVTVANSISGSGTLQAVGASVLGSALNVSGAVTIGTDDDGADRTITFGHSTLKTIMGIDDSANAFVINTDDTFDGTLANNSLSIDGSHNAIIAGNVTAKGRVIVDDATEASSTTDGSLQTDGGLSVVKDAVFGNDVKLLSDSAVLSFGANSDITLTHVADYGLTLGQATETTAEPVFTLKNTGNFASGPMIHFVLDNGAGEGDDDVLGTIKWSGDDDGDAETVFAQITVLSSDVTNNDEGGKIKFEVMAGGIAGDASMTEIFSIGGEDEANSTNCAVVINEASADVDFRVETNGNANTIFAEGSSDRVGIVSNSPNSSLHIGGSMGTAYATISGTSNDLSDAHHVLYASSSGGAAVACELPSVGDVGGRIYSFKLLNTALSGGAVFTINTPNGEQIDGEDGYSIDTPNATIQIQSDSTKWNILNSYYPQEGGH